jgi:hypothetical protein
MPDPAAVPEPAPSEAVLHADITGSRRPIWVIVFIEGILICILSVAVGVLVFQRIGETARVKQDVTDVVSAQCVFYEPLTTAPLDPKTASKAGVQLVEGSRRAWVGLHCAGPLAPPTPLLVQLGRRFGVPITY